MALATLSVDLVAKLSRFEQDLGRATHLAEQNAARMHGAFGKLEGAAKMAVTAFASLGTVAAFKGIIDSADSLDKLSQKLGISVEDLAGFEHAAKLSDLTLEQFGQGVKQLSRYMGEHGDKLKAAGITATDAKGALIQLADQFALMPDGPKKTAIAMELLGKSGADMIPLLNGGGAALRQMIEEGQRLNPVTTEMAKKSAELNDTLTRLHASMKTVGVSITEDMIGPLNRLAKEMESATRVSGNFFANFLMLDGAQTANPSAAIEEIDQRLAKLRQTLDGVKGSWVGRNASWFNADDVAAIEAQIAYAEKQRALLVAMRGDKGGGQAAVRAIDNALLGGTANPTIDRVLGNVEKTVSVKVKFEQDPAFLEAQRIGLNGDNRSASEIMRELHAEDEALARKVQTYRDLIDPMQKYRDKLAEIQQLAAIGIEEGGLSSIEASQATAKIEGEMQRLADSASSAMSGVDMVVANAFKGMGDAVADFVVTGKADFGGLVESMIRDLIRLETQLMMTDVFKSAGGLKGIGEKAFELIASISLDSLWPFANGGVMTASGPLPLRKYASGGIASSPQLALFGEGSMAEAYVPLPDGRRIPVDMRGAGNVQVNVINNASGTQATARERNEGGVRIIDVVVEQIEAKIAGSISSGRGMIPASLEGAYGLNRGAGAY